MLVLSRKPGESLRIGDNIVLRIVSITGNRVKVGIEAPGDIPILRSELPQWSSRKQEIEIDCEEFAECALS